MEKTQLIEKIKEYIPICESLDDKSNKGLLMTLQGKLENQEYLLPFIGQYSAGKSKLINKLLGRDILPTQTRETTAFLTYISYAPTGQSEYAMVCYMDGREEVVSINDVAKFDYASTGDGTDVESIKIYINSPILESGIVFVDTPGVNTLINSHIEMTENLLKESQFIVYVFGKDPSEQDLAMVSKIQSLKISVVFVRTHMDEVNEEEESFESLILHNKEIIEGEIGTSPIFYAVSCKDSEIEKEPWSLKFTELKNYLNKTLSAKSGEIYSDSIDARIQVIANELKNQIEAKLDVLYQAKNLDLDKVEKQKQVIEKAIKDLENDLLRLSKEWNVKCAKKDYDLKESLENVLQSVKYTFRNKLDEVKADETAIKETVTNVCMESVKDANDRLNDKAESVVASFAADCNVEISETLSGIKQSLAENGVQMHCEIDSDTVAGYNDKIYDLKNSLSQKIEELQCATELADAELEQLGVNRSELENTLSQLQSANEELNTALKDLDAGYQPKYIEKSSGIGNILKKVGSACDIAMLLMPAVGFEKAGAMLAGKAATLAGKAGTLAQVGSKVLTVASEGAKVLAATDKIKDSATLLKALPGVLDKVQRKNDLYEQHGANAMRQLIPAGDFVAPQKANIFDYLSLSYWFGKVGEVIDPPTIEIDKEYEQKYSDARRNIEDQNKLILEQTIAERRRLGTIKDKEAELETRKKLAARQAERISKDTASKIQELQEERNRRVVSLYKDSAKMQFDKSVDDFKNMLYTRCKDALTDVKDAYLRTTEGMILNEMESKKAQIEQILKEHNEASINEDIEKWNNCLATLA